MERDIRDLFNKNEEQKKGLPKNHREDFIKKLESLPTKKETKSSYKTFKIVASVLLIIANAFFYKSTISTPIKTAFEIQIEAIEQEYLINIDKEWSSFIEVANDSILVKKYEVKLKESDVDYKKITKQLKENPNNINVLESLINNLQRRLQLIKDIKEHLKELNQKNISNETIYL